MFMFPYSQPTSPAARAHIEAQYSLFTDMSRKIFDSAQKINELNIQVAKTMMEETLNSTQQVLVAKDPLEALSVATSQAQPTAEKIRAYQQHLNNIAAGAQVDLARSAESHVPQTSRTAAALADEVARTASEQTEQATQRQRAVMEKLTNPIAPNKAGDSKGQGASQAARAGA